MDLSYGLGAVGVTKRLDTGETLTSETYYGVTLAGGYEYMSDGGFFVHRGFGVTHFDRTPLGHTATNVPTIGVALGYKF